MQPRIYYGEEEDVPFVVVNTQADELDYQGTAEGADEQVTYRYEGTGGIQMGNLLQRAVFAYHFRDVNLLLSGLIDSQSRIMIYRALRTRVEQAVPFLTLDHDPYAAVIDGRVQWIWDAYTTSAQYPYSQETDLAVPTNGGMTGTANYIRNSVKVVVDAYDGTITYYVTDPSDPIIQVWQTAFPDLFTPVTEASEELVEHFRYPEGLFQVQADSSPTTTSTIRTCSVRSRTSGRSPPIPRQGRSGESRTDPTAPQTPLGTLPPLDPYYVLMTLPDETQEELR